MSEGSSGQVSPPAADAFVASGTLIVVAPQVILATAEKPEDRESVRRRLVTSVLLAVFFGVVTIWFSVHVKTFITGVVILGSFTFWSALGVFLAQFKSAVGDEATKTWKRLLGHAITYRLAILLVFIAPFLFVVTSSIHFKLGKTKAPGAELLIFDDGKDAPRTPIDNVRLSETKQIAGRPMLPVFRARRFRVEVVRPRGYHPLLLSLQPGQPIDVAFPDDFSKRSIVRIYAPYALADMLPHAGEPQFERSDLHITAAGQTAITSRKVAITTAYVGVREQSIAEELVAASLQDYENTRRWELRAAGLKEQDINTKLATWRMSRVVSLKWDLKEGDVVTAQIRVDQKPRFGCSARVVEDVVTNCILQEMKQ